MGFLITTSLIPFVVLTFFGVPMSKSLLTHRYLKKSEVDGRLLELVDSATEADFEPKRMNFYWIWVDPLNHFQSRHLKRQDWRQALFWTLITPFEANRLETENHILGNLFPFPLYALQLASVFNSFEELLRSQWPCISLNFVNSIFVRQTKFSSCLPVCSFDDDGTPQV